MGDWISVNVDVQKQTIIIKMKQLLELDKITNIPHSIFAVNHI